MTLTVAGAAATLAAQEERWLGATLVEGQIEFEPPESIEWERLAPGDLMEFELSKAEPGLLSTLNRKRDMFDNAELPFEAPLPDSLQKRFFYFVSQDGIQELRGERLKGIVRFSLGKDGTLVERIVYGYVTATAVVQKNLAPAGFVLALHQPTAFEISEATHETKHLVPQEVRDNWDTLSTAGRQFWTVEKQYAFRFQGEDRYLTFVQWVPDRQCHEGCCQFRYFVLVGRETPQIIATHNSGCDV